MNVVQPIKPSSGRVANAHRDPAQVPGTTFEFIEAHALADMKRPAVLIGGLTISYGRVWQSVINVACMLHKQGVRAGDRLAVNVIDTYTHWMCLLAAEAIGAVTCSLNFGEAPELSLIHI